MLADTITQLARVFARTYSGLATILVDSERRGLLSERPGEVGYMQ